jgi:septum formation protein
MSDTTAPQAIYLASKSPRRAELLRQLGVEFTELRLREAPGRERDVVEGPRPGEAARDYVTRIARTKALVAWHRMGQRSLPPLPVLAADTEVVLDGAIYGKPADAADAARMLTELSGRTHEVMTALFLKCEQVIYGVVSTSRVTFRALDAAEIERYCASAEPLDKAGAYAIQGRGAAFVERLEGSYSGVVGLPLFETAGALARIGVSVL